MTDATCRTALIQRATLGAKPRAAPGEDALLDVGHAVLLADRLVAGGRRSGGQAALRERSSTI